MKFPQIIAIIIAAGLLAAIYFFVNTKPPLNANAQKPNAQSAEHSQMSQEIVPINEDELFLKAVEKLAEKDKTFANTNKNSQDKAILEQMHTLFHKVKEQNMAAKYNAALAKLENTEKSLTFASQLFIDLYNVEHNPSLRAWQAGQAAQLLEKVLAINPANENAKVALGACYTDGTGETMKGVLLLREVATANPQNLTAGLALGRLAVQSGQFDKAIARLEKLNTIHPNNKEVIYFLAEAYKGSGNTTKAKELFNICKQMVNDPEFSKEIDAYIKTF